MDQRHDIEFHLAALQEIARDAGGYALENTRSPALIKITRKVLQDIVKQRPDGKNTNFWCLLIPIGCHDSCPIGFAIKLGGSLT